MPDPYDWLGIPKAHRPPTHYQLLGLAPSVTNPAEIKAAADRQLRRLQPHLTGPDGNTARILRVEVNRARDTLLDPEKRAVYDTLSPDAEAPEAPAREPDIDVELVSEPPDEATVETAEEPAATPPWWQEAAPEDATTGPAAWWQEPPPADEPAAPVPAAPSAPPTPGPRPGVLEPSKRKPKPAPPPPSARSPKPAQPEPSVVEPIARPPELGPRRTPVLAIFVGALVVTAVVSGGTYLALNRATDDTPKDELKPIAKNAEDGRPKQKPDLKENELLPIEGAVPKGFADGLRPKMFRGHEGSVNGVAVSRSGLRVFTAGMDKSVRVWSVPRDDVTTRHRFLSPGVAVALYGEDRGIAACDSLTVALMDATRMKAPKPLESPRGGVSGLAVTADGAKVLTGMTDGYLRLWDVASGQFDEWAVAPRGPIAVAMTPDGATGLAAPADGPVSVWDLRNRTKVHEWEAHPGGAISVELAADRTRAVTAGPEGAVAVYDLTEKKELWRKPAHRGPLAGAAWLSDGKQVVTAGTDGTARLWNAETGLARRWTQTLDGKATCLAVDGQDRFLLVGTSNGTVHLFPLPRVKVEALSGPAARPPADPLPVPDAESVAAAIGRVRSELATEFGYTRPDDVALLADNLRRRAAAEDAPPPLRFGLLQEARALAIQAADPITAVGAVEDLAAWFDVDELAEKAATLNALPADSDPVTVARLALAAAERAEAEGRPEVVQRVLKKLPSEAPAGFPPDQGPRLVAVHKRAAAAAAELARVRQAVGALRKAPDDQAANHTLGVFLALTRQDWAAGLPHLAKGSDPGLIEAAKADRNGAADAKGQLRVADLWFRLAVNAGDHRHKRALLGRSRVWYDRVVTRPKVELADMVKAKARIGEVDSLNVPSRDPNALPIMTPVPIRRAYSTLGADVLKSEWQLEGGAAARPDGVHLPAGSPAIHSRFGVAVQGRLTLVVRPDGRELRVNCAGQEFAFGGTGKVVRLVIERTAATVTVIAISDADEPVSRTADLAPLNRGPTRVTLRLTGVAADPNGTLITAGMVRGPIALPHPVAE